MVPIRIGTEASICLSCRIPASCKSLGETLPRDFLVGELEHQKLVRLEALRTCDVYYWV